MSLINDALKKAQSMQPQAGLKLAAKSRSEAPKPPKMPAPLGPVSAAVASEPAPAKKSAKPALVLVVAGVVFLVALGVLGVTGAMIWKHGVQPKADPTSADEPASVAQTKPAPSAESPEVSKPAPIAEQVRAVPAAAPAKTPLANPAPKPTADTPASVTSAPSRPTAQPASDVEAAAPAPDEEVEADIEEPALPSRPPDPQLQAYALSLKVTGIRTGDHPKALMNGRVYSVGEYISTEHDLRLKSVTSRSLDLEDSAGNVYEVRF